MSKDQIQKQCIGFANTPPLWQGFEFGIDQFEFPEMELNDFIPDEIPMNIRLGHQMEHVFKQLIKHSKRYEILVHNLPIRDDNRTLGEIDFILKNVETDQLIHVELTYKFYVIDPKIEEPVDQLIGPNRGDAFFAKVQKIRQKQFELLHSSEGVKTLKMNSIDHNVISHQVCYKTQLYIPKNTNNQLVTQLNTNCIYGYWISFENFNSEEYYSFRFYIPTKSEWVIEPHENIVWNDYDKTLIELQIRMQQKKSTMVWMKKSKSNFEKFFVVWWKTENTNYEVRGMQF